MPKMKYWPKTNEGWKITKQELIEQPGGTVMERTERVRTFGDLKKLAFVGGFFDEIDKIAAEAKDDGEEEEKPRKKRKMPHFTEQDRPEGVKKIYRALAHRKQNAEEMRKRYGKNWKEVAARIAARQGKAGKQKQGPPYKAPLGGKED